MTNSKQTKSILFIDEFHMLVGAGSAGSAVDAANILKPALSRGELQCIGATTLDEYRKHIESDAALERRFQPIVVDEPTVEETIEILKGIRKMYEEHHHLVIADDALESAAKLSARYVSDRFLPDKAIDLIDESASRVRMYKSGASTSAKELYKQLKQARAQPHPGAGGRQGGGRGHLAGAGSRPERTVETIEDRLGAGHQPGGDRRRHR